MKGKIKAYSTDVNAGVISGDDGKSYHFGKNEWTGKTLPQSNENEQFTPADRAAVNVRDTSIGDQ